MYKFTEEQIMIRDMVREFTKNEVAPYDKAMDETFSFNMEVYQQIYSKLVETGLMGIHIPEQYGGGGGDAITSQIVVNELAKGSASIARISSTAARPGSRTPVLPTTISSWRRPIPTQAQGASPFSSSPRMQKV